MELNQLVITMLGIYIVFMVNMLAWARLQKIVFIRRKMALYIYDQNVIEIYRNKHRDGFSVYSFNAIDKFATIGELAFSPKFILKDENEILERFYTFFDQNKDNFKKWPLV